MKRKKEVTDTCLNCVHAEWDRTRVGALHPSGDGRCAYEVLEIVLPAVKYFIGGSNVYGGYISRRVPRTGCPTHGSVSTVKGRP